MDPVKAHTAARAAVLAAAACTDDTALAAALESAMSAAVAGKMAALAGHILELVIRWEAAVKAAKATSAGWLCSPEGLRDLRAEATAVKREARGLLRYWDEQKAVA